MRGIFSFLLFVGEVLRIIIIALAIVVPIRYFLFQPFFVRGQSMEPNFSNGDYLIVDELSYRFSDPERGDIIVFKYPHNPSQRYIKRIIGLPQETIEIAGGEVIIYSEEEKQVLDETAYLSFELETPGDVKVSLEEGEYFVLGDNRPLSSDSRSWGPLTREHIVGKVFVRAWPLTALARIEAPAY